MRMDQNRLFTELCGAHDRKIIQNMVPGVDIWTRPWYQAVCRCDARIGPQDARCDCNVEGVICKGEECYDI